MKIHLHSGTHGTVAYGQEGRRTLGEDLDGGFADEGVFLLAAEALARVSTRKMRKALRWFARRSPQLLAEVADFDDRVTLGGMVWLYEREGLLEHDGGGAGRPSEAASARSEEIAAVLAPIGLDRADRRRAVACVTHMRATAGANHIELARAMVEVHLAWEARS